MRADLLYFDVINTVFLRSLPDLLNALGEERCFIFNHEVITAPEPLVGRVAAMEVTRESDPRQIEFHLSNKAADHLDYLSVFYLVGDFGIVSPSRDWLVFARTDEYAFVTSDHEWKYSLFNKSWWSNFDEKKWWWKGDEVP